MDNYLKKFDLEAMNEKYSTKNLLFYRAIPQSPLLEVPNGHKLFNCIDCGDRFFFKSSYTYHLNRKSLKIMYYCRQCSTSQHHVFYNRCALLSHIRTHTFKTATINVYDLKVEPLPLNFYKKTMTSAPKHANTVAKVAQTTCNECNEVYTVNGPIYKDRAAHYMKLSDGEVHSCPICLFTLPTICALKAHLRIHLKLPPFLCPECGCFLSNKSINYPYNHSCCEGFKMMRATARMKCFMSKCNLIHPTDYKEHIKTEHLKKVLKCRFCAVACFNEDLMSKHLLNSHGSQLYTTSPPLSFYQCEMCQGKLVLQNHLNIHLNSHHVRIKHVYPCWVCGTVYEDVTHLVNHHVNCHLTNENLKIMYESLKPYGSSNAINKIYRVVKRCDQCLRSFTYKCNYDDINVLPNICPYNCTSSSKQTKEAPNDEKRLVCTLCKIKINENWTDVKEHYSAHHKEHKCLDANIILHKLDIKKYTNIQKNTRKRSRNSRNSGNLLKPIGGSKEA